MNPAPPARGGARQPICLALDNRADTQVRCVMRSTATPEVFVTVNVKRVGTLGRSYPKSDAQCQKETSGE